MNNDKYDATIDRFIEIMIISGYFALISFIIFIILFCAVVLFCLAFFDGFTISWIIIMSGVVSLIISTPLTFMGYYLKIARKKFHNTTFRYRDFWMGYATCVELKAPMNPDDVLSQWVKENIKHLYYKVGGKVYFASKKDAVAFKLRWA